MIKVVLVEDNAMQGEIYAETFADKGFDVHIVRESKHAIQIIDYVKPDLVILDITMPEIDGLELARIITETSAIPVMMLTGSEDPAHVIAAVNIGCVDYVSKSAATCHILDVVKKHGLVSLVKNSLLPLKSELETMRNKYRKQI